MAGSAVLLRANADFRRYWTGQALSAFGSTLTSIALVLVVLHVTGSAAWAGAVATVRLLVLLVARVPGGVLADRWSRRRVLVGIDLAKAALWAAPAVLLAAGRCEVPLLLAVAAVDGVLSAVYNPAAAAVLGRLVPPDRLTRALSLNEARSYTAGLVGPAVGGALFALAPALPLALDAATYLCCAVLTARIGTSLGGGPARPEPAHSEPAHFGPARHRGAPGGGFWGEARTGLAYLGRQPFLLVLAAWSALLNLATAAAFFGLVPVLDSAGVAPGAIGVASGLVSVGAVGGALLAPRLAGGPAYPVLIASSALAVAVTAAVVLAPLPPVLTVALAALSTLGPLLVVLLNSRVYALVPDHLMGRVQSSLVLAGSALYPFGSLVMGGVLQAYGPRTGYAGVALVLAGCVALCLTRPVRAELAPHPVLEPALASRR